ncbi:MAG: Hpt domain-containing protein [Deltaproteobacteria bacterium]|nr:Hpt domain-containing protein [Deltaproteobacteria bacterium]
MDALPVLDPIALERLRSLADAVARPGEDVLGHLVQIFVEDSDARLQVLEKACTDGETAAGARAAHNIKGAAANMGALRVVAAAVVVERACRASPPALLILGSAVETLGRELKDAVVALRRSFALRE